MLVGLLFCIIIMTAEPTHTALEEGMVPGLLFLSKRALQLSITEIAKWSLCFVFSYVCSACYTVLEMKNTMRRTSAVNPVTT